MSEAAPTPQVYHKWFRARVWEALADMRPAIADEEVSTHFAQRRADLLKRIEGGED
jgi:hypothetical protein